jgi:small subunit ribosomal protein S13
MARISGVDLPDNKRVEVGLTYIKGIGFTLSKRILEAAGVEAGKKVKDLSEDEINRIANEIGSNHIVEGELSREAGANIRRLMEIGSYRGMRHKRKLPCRGQQTRTNARTLKGTKRTVGMKKKKAVLPGQK